MKNYFNLFSIAVVGLMLGACSNEDIVDDKGGAQWNNEGTGYVNLSIKLPTTANTTRGVNDQFDDGKAEEYAVKDATLILFSGTSESAATIAGAYDLNLNFTHVGTSTDEITTTANITQKINSIPGTDNIYALVVLNKQNLLTVDGADLKINGTSMAGKTLSGLNDAVKGVIGTTYSWHGNGFLMSNAVLTTEVGGTSQPAGSAESLQTLAPIDREKIYSTEAQSSANPAAVIYVERAEAKVTVDKGANLSGTVTDGSNLKYEVDGWVLDNTNKTNKLVRTVAGYSTWAALATNAPSVVDKYRFVGSAAVGKDVTGAKTFYRVYWGDDYNYDATNKAEDLNFFADKTVPSVTFNGLGSDDYCFENTATLNTMRENNNTRVIVRVKFNEGEPFFKIDADVNKLYTEADAKTEVAARVLGDGGVNAWVEANLAAGQKFNSATDFVVTFPENLGAGGVKVAKVEIAEAAKAKFKENTDFTKAPDFTAVANNDDIITLNYYAGGYSYYPVYVAHFGDDLTPWDNGETAAPSSENIYPGGDANYLGRWGVLRNNWYNINVTAIRSLGAPTVEEAEGTIDKKENFISVTVNILPWAVRTQNVEL